MDLIDRIFNDDLLYQQFYDELLKRLPKVITTKAKDGTTMLHLIDCPLAHDEVRIDCDPMECPKVTPCACLQVGPDGRRR